jgi:hypothetical protein
LRLVFVKDSVTILTARIFGDSLMRRQASLGPILVATSILTGIMLAANSHAAVVITANETAGNVVFSTQEGGSLDLNGLTYFNTLLTGNGINPSGQVVLLGGSGPESADIYTGVTQPGPFGPDFENAGPDSSTGDRFGVSFGAEGGLLIVPIGYQSDDPLNGTMTYWGQTFTSLNIESGTYVWSWSTDSLTLVVPSVVPIPAAVWLFGSALAGLGWMRRKQTA